jgi:hypothetical protein
MALRTLGPLGLLLGGALLAGCATEGSDTDPWSSARDDNENNGSGDGDGFDALGGDAGVASVCMQDVDAEQETIWLCISGMT